jgi:hypothetical protein
MVEITGTPPEAMVRLVGKVVFSPNLNGSTVPQHQTVRRVTSKSIKSSNKFFCYMTAFRQSYIFFFFLVKRALLLTDVQPARSSDTDGGDNLPDTHFFNVPLAVKYGQENSVILSNLCYWIKHNAQNNINFFEGRYWTYNTLSAFEKQFPYFSVSQIRTILANLKKSGAVLTGNFNKRAFDRTLWYSVPDEVFLIYEGQAEAEQAPGADMPDKAAASAPEDAPQGEAMAPVPEAPICENSQMHLSNSANAFAEFDRPIPNKNKVINESTTSTSTPSQDSSVVVAASYIDELKANFAKIDPALHFDKGFYFKAWSILEKYGLDNKYLAWLYEFCKKKQPADLTAYYFSVFGKESLINRFIAARAPPAQETAVCPVVCPVCGANHAKFADCPVCGFSGERDAKKIVEARFIYNMPDDSRAAYEKELAAVAAVIEVISFEERLSLIRAIRRKYGIPE